MISMKSYNFLLLLLLGSKKNFCLNNKMVKKESSWPDWKYPSWRESVKGLTIEGWLEGRREADGAEGLWRVHDGLYNLSSWVHSHPGGSEWLTNTKGTDITEAFEAHHIGPLPLKMLKNFYVRLAKTPRNSAFTFQPNGFYPTLKSRVYEKLKNVTPGPSIKSKLILDALATATIVLSILAAVHKNVLYGTLAGVFLTQLTIGAHNFLHMRDNWRMYYFNMSLFTVREWRVSHALSHHLFPNTHYDMEVHMFEPLHMVYLPKTEKSRVYGLVSVILSPLVYPFLFFITAIFRLLTSRIQSQDLIGFLLPVLLVVVGHVTLYDAIVTWLYIIMVGSFFFGLVTLNAAHHHPEIFHYGDKPREDRDWGLFTLDATRDRKEVYGTPYLVLVMFGDHALHHLFPTIDHVHLHKLYPILEQTCKEFGIDYKLKSSWDLFTGQFRQLMRNQPNLK